MFQAVIKFSYLRNLLDGIRLNHCNFMEMKKVLQKCLVRNKLHTVGTGFYTTCQIIYFLRLCVVLFILFLVAEKTKLLPKTTTTPKKPLGTSTTHFEDSTKPQTPSRVLMKKTSFVSPLKQTPGPSPLR